MLQYKLSHAENSSSIISSKCISILICTPGQMASVSQPTSLKSFSWMKVLGCQCEFHLNSSLRVQLTTCWPRSLTHICCTRGRWVKRNYVCGAMVIALHRPSVQRFSVLSRCVTGRGWGAGQWLLRYDCIFFWTWTWSVQYISQVAFRDICIRSVIGKRVHSDVQRVMLLGGTEIFQNLVLSSDQEFNICEFKCQNLVSMAWHFTVLSCIWLLHALDSCFPVLVKQPEAHLLTRFKYNCSLDK